MPVPDHWVQGEYLVIRHIPTGKMLPQIHTRQKGGGSFLEPDDVWRHPPRLFYNMASAKAFLGQWLKGRHVAVRDQDGHLEGTNIEPVSSRIRAEMEIVPLKLVLEPRS
jgi:hypothetical protein